MFSRSNPSIFAFLVLNSAGWMARPSHIAPRLDLQLPEARGSPCSMGSRTTQLISDSHHND